MKKNKKDKINIGTVTGSVGLRGEIKIFHNADSPDTLLSIKSFLIEDEAYDIEKIRYRKKIPIVKLKGIETRDASEGLVKKDIFIKADMLPDLPENTYYVKDLVGLDVISINDGCTVGVIKNVITNTAQDVYEIETTDNKTLLLPAVTEVVKDINVRQGTMTVQLPDGIEDIKY